ncbi:chaplin [Streptomyces sp. RB6PN25]|uniref:Chaplin n=1 Tax=Streptomyces humicola TaxID=2953240 RepID=A0ABT1Q186_9ACTN|nr:chaplin [Streptomyces humicola]MCQ4083035.1 chaplin [Streptomyces humicola]
MRQVARKGLVTAMATGGMLAAAAGYAHADSGAAGSAVGSPGVLSGNLVQLPIDVPVNVCGNTVDVVGVLNPSVGNSCVNASHGGGPRHMHPLRGGATARGHAADSPGVASGNGIQLPVDLPVNVSGNSVNVVGIGNAAVGNTAVNAPGHGRHRRPCPPAPAPRAAVPLTAGTSAATLAHTGTDSLGFALPASAGMLLGGTLLYRRFRPTKS